MKGAARQMGINCKREPVEEEVLAGGYCFEGKEKFDLANKVEKVVAKLTNGATLKTQNK